MSKLHLWHRKIDLVQAAGTLPADRVEKAKRDAKNHESPIFSELPYTESNYTWVLLYDHIRRGQIRPDALKKMRRSDLEYLAGHPVPHPELLDRTLYGTEDEYSVGRGQAIKAVENITRATRELERRTAWWRGWALVAGGAVFTAIVQIIS